MHLLELYAKRREFQLNELKYELDILSEKARFILMVVNDELIISKRKRGEIENDLEENDFKKLGVKNLHGESFDYLLNMPIYQLTYEKIEELKKQKEIKEAEYNKLNKMKPHDIWKIELVELKEALNKINQETVVDKPLKKKK